ncbi:MAG: helix-hairpin-helix domain-containing protein [Candidatus Limnocylindrales bacterium]
MPRWLAPALATLGGITAGVAMTGLAVVALVSPGADAPFMDRAPAGPAWASGSPVVTDEPAELVVDVAGAVADPGLHRLRPGDRVGDAIAAAGGFAPRADLAASSQALNLAQPLEDGAKVLVPELGIDRAETQLTADDGRIDINRAGRSELESLPGIGPVTAGNIIAAREDERFETVRELRGRGLVGEKVFEDIKGLVRAS